MNIAADKASHIMSNNQAGYSTHAALANEEQEKWNNLVSWITENGGFVDPRGVLATANESGVRGMFATEDIAKDTVLARIPPAVRLQDGPDITNWVARGDLATTAGLLSLAREHHKGTGSHFYPWLNIVPAFEDYLQFHPQAVLLAADAEGRGRRVAEWNAIIPGFGNTIFNRVQKFDKFIASCIKFNAKDELFQDHEVFSTRNMQFVDLTRQSRWWSSLREYVPYADMFNHNAANHHVELLQEGDDWLVVAVADLQAGEQIFHRYGVHDHEAMFAGWGFCEWNREIRFKRMTIDISGKDSVMGHAISYMVAKQEEELGKQGGSHYVRATGLSPSLWKLLRTSSLDYRDLSSLLAKRPEDPTGLLDKEPVSIDNELLAIGKGIQLSKQVRAKFLKSAEEYKEIAGNSKDYVIAMLARIAVEDIELLESFEKSLRKIWTDKLEKELEKYEN